MSNIEDFRGAGSHTVSLDDVLLLLLPIWGFLLKLRPANSTKSQVLPTWSHSFIIMFPPEHGQFGSFQKFAAVIAISWLRIELPEEWRESAASVVAA